MNNQEFIENKMKLFCKEFTISHPGDSGFNGGDPQEPVYELNIDDPNEIEYFLFSSLQELEKRHEEQIKGIREDIASIKFEEDRNWQDHSYTGDPILFGEESAIKEVLFLSSLSIVK